MPCLRLPHIQCRRRHAVIRSTGAPRRRGAEAPRRKSCGRRPISRMCSFPLLSQFLQPRVAAVRWLLAPSLSFLASACLFETDQDFAQAASSEFTGSQNPSLIWADLVASQNKLRQFSDAACSCFLGCAGKREASTRFCSALLADDASAKQHAGKCSFAGCCQNQCSLVDFSSA